MTTREREGDVFRDDDSTTVGAGNDEASRRTARGVTSERPLRLGAREGGDVLRGLLKRLDLAVNRVDGVGLDEDATRVEVDDDELALRGRDVVEVEDVLLDGDVGGDHDAVDGGDHGAREARSAGRGDDARGEGRNGLKRGLKRRPMARSVMAKSWRAVEPRPRWTRGVDVDAEVGFGVAKRDALGVEQRAGDATRGERRVDRSVASRVDRSAVSHVADERKSERRAVKSDLVRATGERGATRQRDAVSSAVGVVGARRFAKSQRHAVGDHALDDDRGFGVLDLDLFVPGKRAADVRGVVETEEAVFRAAPTREYSAMIFNAVVIRRRRAQRDVRLLHRAVGELRRQAANGVSISRDDETSGGVAVESVNDARRLRGVERHVPRRRAVIDRGRIIAFHHASLDEAFYIVHVRLRRLVQDVDVVVDVHREQRDAGGCVRSRRAFARLRALALDRARCITRRPRTERRFGIFGRHLAARREVMRRRAKPRASSVANFCDANDAHPILPTVQHSDDRRYTHTSVFHNVESASHS